MPVVEIDLDQAEKFYGELLHKAIRKGAIDGCYSAALRMVNEIQTKIIPETTPSPVDRSTYKAGWRAEPTSDGAVYENVTPHASHVEHGVRAENIKVGATLIDALAEWAERKGIASGDEARRAAWRIATSMAAQVRRTTKAGTPVVVTGKGRGIFDGGKGLRVMARANELLEKILGEEVAREVDRAIGGIG